MLGLALGFGALSGEVNQALLGGFYSYDMQTGQVQGQ